MAGTLLLLDVMLKFLFSTLWYTKLISMWYDSEIIAFLVWSQIGHCWFVQMIKLSETLHKMSWTWGEACTCEVQAHAGKILDSKSCTSAAY